MPTINPAVTTYHFLRLGSAGSMCSTEQLGCQRGLNSTPQWTGTYNRHSTAVEPLRIAARGRYEQWRAESRRQGLGTWYYRRPEAAQVQPTPPLQGEPLAYLGRSGTGAQIRGRGAAHAALRAWRPSLEKPGSGEAGIRCEGGRGCVEGWTGSSMGRRRRGLPLRWSCSR